MRGFCSLGAPSTGVCTQLDTVADMLGRKFPKVREMLLEAKEDLTAFVDFPHQHWKMIQSTNPLDRLNREIKRRTDVVQLFPNPPAPSDSPPRSSPNSTTNGSPSPAATSPTRAWTPSIPMTRSSCPPHQTTDRLHHDKGHDLSSALDDLARLLEQCASTPGSYLWFQGD